MLAKSDIKWLKENLVTKNDAKNFVTKDDLKNFATKDDLKPLTTKGDLKKLEKKLDTKFTQLFNYIDKDLMETQRKVKIIEETLRISPVS